MGEAPLRRKVAPVTIPERSSAEGGTPWLEVASLALLIVAQIAILIAAAIRNRFDLNPDAIAYLQIARHVADLRFDLALNGYWGPLLSWLMAPFLGFGIDRLLTARIVLATSAVLFLLGAIALIRALGLRRQLLFLAALVTAAASVAWSVDAVTPDLLAAAFLLFAFATTVSESWATTRRSQVIAGVLWSLGYLAKAVVLPVGVVVVTLYALVAALVTARRREHLIAAGVTLLTLLLSAAPWVIALSAKYGKPTFSTAGPIAHALVGPSDIDRRNPLILGFRTPERGRLLVSEDPSRLPFAYWSPLASRAYAKHQLDVVRRNSSVIAERIQAFDRFHFGFWTLVLSAMVLLARPRLAARFRWLIAPIPVFAATLLYVPLWANDARYYYFAFPFAAAVVFGLCGLVARGSRAAGGAILVVAAFSFLSPAWHAGRAALDPAPDEPVRAARELAARLESLRLAGPVAGSGTVNGSMAALYVAFLLDEPWVGDQPELDLRALEKSDAVLYVVSRSERATVQRLERGSAFQNLDRRLFADPRDAERFPLVAFIRNEDARE
ncbi:MAG TPA: hypothetical protein VGF40_19915 [Thermoanaerobaculia bacterium]